MKISCPGKHGIHFEAKELKPACSYWRLHGLRELKPEYKKQIAEWLFALPVDEIAVKQNILLQYDIKGTKQKGKFKNEWAKKVRNYNKLTEAQQRELQRQYFKFRNDPELIEKLIWSLFIAKYGKS